MPHSHERKRGVHIDNSTLATCHNLNYNINYYSLTKKGGGPDPLDSPPGSAPELPTLTHVMLHTIS